MVRRNALEWFQDYRYQTHMTAASLWEKMTRRRFRDRRDRMRLTGKKAEEGVRRERLDCSKLII